jgi:hypothetical protein
MGIIKPALRRKEENNLVAYDEVAPFVPAYDLAANLPALTEAEAAAVAITLQQLLPSLDSGFGAWGQLGLQQQFSQRR